ncbi:MFS transporter [Streptomyces sp. NPDC047082]|uniref:MFS transporter n=1 Tax=Streptomyces sp. NPDC047082 TaxID=3155259 RepID=UPI00340E2EA6
MIKVERQESVGLTIGIAKALRGAHEGDVTSPLLTRFASHAVGPCGVEKRGFCMNRILRSLCDDLVPRTRTARRLAFLTLIQSTGTGLFLTSSAIFFTRVIGFTPQSVALVLSIAGFCGFLSTVPAGRLADRFGARTLLAGNYAALSVLFVLYCFSDIFAVFAVVASLIAVGETAGSPLRAALTFSLFGRETATKVRAQMRSIFNLGSMAGAAMAGVALAAGTRQAFYSVIVVNACAQLICAVVTLGLREPARPGRERRQSGSQSRAALRDYRFIAVTLASGLLELHNAMLNIGIPLWITIRLRESGSLNSVVMISNTLLVLLFQVRLSRGAESAQGAAILQRRSGTILMVSCLLFAGAAVVPHAWVAPLIVLAAVVMVFGEIYQAAGSWGISFELPPPERQGEYQGVFALGRGLQQFVGPMFVTALVINVGAFGWIVLGIMFVAVGALCVPLVRAAEKGATNIFAAA